MLSMHQILLYLLRCNKPLVPEEEIANMLQWEELEWQKYAEECKGMIVTSPGMVPQIFFYLEGKGFVEFFLMRTEISIKFHRTLTLIRFLPGCGGRLSSVSIATWNPSPCGSHTVVVAFESSTNHSGPLNIKDPSKLGNTFCLAQPNCQT